MTKSKLPFLRHTDSQLQFAWNCAQLGLLIFPLIPALGGGLLGLVLLITWLQKYHTIIRRPHNWGFALFSLLLIISTSLAFDKKEALLGLFNFLPFILFFAAFSTLIQSPAQLRRLSWILVITSVPVLIIGFGQLFAGWNTPQQWEGALGWAIAAKGNPSGRMASIFMYANTLAAYLVIIFILGLGLWLEAYRNYRKKDKRISSSLIFLTVIVIANFAALILTNSRNAWAIAFLACLAFAIYQGWRMLVAGVVSIVTTILLAAFAPAPIAGWFRNIVPDFFWARLNDQMYPDRPIALLRTTQWHFAWSMTQQRPWTGWGLRNFTQLYQANMHIWLGHPHNLFLMLCAETGLPATILFFALLVWLFIRGAKLLQSSKSLKPEDKVVFFSYLLVLGAWVIFNTFDVTIFDLRLNTLSWLLLAAIFGVVYHYEHSKAILQNYQI